MQCSLSIGYIKPKKKIIFFYSLLAVFEKCQINNCACRKVGDLKDEEGMLTTGLTAFKYIKDSKGRDQGRN